MNLELDRKTAFVAGASRGIGLAIAQSLFSEGCNLALAARGKSDLETAAKFFSSRVSIHSGDLVKAEIANAMVTDAAQRWNGLDILICNVGSGRSAAPGEESEAEWRRVLDLNLFATINTIAAARPHLRAGSAIICISSICGLAALGAPITYSAAKAALNATVKGLARPFAKDGIRINAVAPGNILFPDSTWDRKLQEDKSGVEAMLAREVALGRLGIPDEIAALATFLASPKAGFITGAVYVADGGQLR